MPKPNHLPQGSPSFEPRPTESQDLHNQLIEDMQANLAEASPLLRGISSPRTKGSALAKLVLGHKDIAPVSISELLLLIFEFRFILNITMGERLRP
jgi:hypothetical protein